MTTLLGEPTHIRNNAIPHNIAVCGATRNTPTRKPRHASTRKTNNLRTNKHTPHHTEATTTIEHTKGPYEVPTEAVLLKTSHTGYPCEPHAEQPTTEETQPGTPHTTRHTARNHAYMYTRRAHEPHLRPLRTQQANHEHTQPTNTLAHSQPNNTTNKSPNTETEARATIAQLEPRHTQHPIARAARTETTKPTIEAQCTKVLHEAPDTVVLTKPTHTGYPDTQHTETPKIAQSTTTKTTNMHNLRSKKVTLHAPESLPTKRTKNNGTHSKNKPLRIASPTRIQLPGGCQSQH